MSDAVVIGGGPAGLMAAEVLARAGRSVCVVDAMPSVGRKFLMAGKSGLNLTKHEDPARFLAAFGLPRPAALDRALRDFGPDQVMAWARGLDQPLFTGSTGRVFPVAMKASPLLRAWLARLDAYGVTLHKRWRWTGWHGDALAFATPQGNKLLSAKTTVLALGGASWARLGADGAWAELMPENVTPFAPANMGFDVAWSPHMAPFLGCPVKSVRLTAGHITTRGEWVITTRGIEGGGVYTVSAALRDGATLSADLLPDWSQAKLQAALAKPRGKTSLSTYLRKVLRFDPLRMALFNEFGRAMPGRPVDIIKSLPIRTRGPRPIDEAISTAGGVRFDAMGDDLMLTSRPGTFCAGEMLDWEAPTGGYLLTGCLATGRLAGKAAAMWCEQM